MSKEKKIDIITDLLIDFDEMGFAPTTICPDPDAYAKEWRNKLSDALQGYRKQSEWISVEERLPEDDDYVLAVATCVPKLNINYVNAVVVTYFSEKEGFIDVEIDEVLEGVSHWMPLPEASKMKGE